MNPRIKVLIVDDSPMVREYLQFLIEPEDDLVVVGQAPNGSEAVRLTKLLKPDVISMDVHMPVMNGLEAVREIMHEHPTPIVMVSASLHKSETDLAFNAVRAGALAVLQKPPDPSHHTFQMAKQELLDTLRLMSKVAVVHHWAPRPSQRIVKPSSSEKLETPPEARIEMVGIASSTGGPSALAEILRNLPYPFPVPITIVQHISPQFEVGLIQWLQQLTPSKVGLAKHGHIPKAGEVWIAPANVHLKFNSQGQYVLDTQRGDYLNFPSANVMLHSMAQVFGRYSLGITLTGMGDDGATGIREIHQMGGITLAQDEESCVVFGMPKEAIALGGVNYIVPLDRISKVMTAIVGGRK